jgi:transcriptional regulator GlxA family with amidase domain
VVSRAVEEQNRRLLRARDTMDRDYAQPLDIPTLARIALVSQAHFIRTFRATFGESPTAICSGGASSGRCSC